MGRASVGVPDDLLHARAFLLLLAGIQAGEALHVHLRLAVRRQNAVDLLHDVGKLGIAVALAERNLADGLRDAGEAREERFLVGYLIVVAPGQRGTVDTAFDCMISILSAVN